jgi:hypothetical protein
MSCFDATLLSVSKYPATWHALLWRAGPVGQDDGGANLSADLQPQSSAALTWPFQDHDKAALAIQSAGAMAAQSRIAEANDVIANEALVFC